MITPEQYITKVVDKFREYQFKVYREDQVLDPKHRPNPKNPNGVRFDHESQRIIPGDVVLLRPGLFQIHVVARVEYPITRGESFDLRGNLASVQPVGVIKYYGHPSLEAEFDLNQETLSRVQNDVGILDKSLEFISASPILSTFQQLKVLGAAKVSLEWGLDEIVKAILSKHGIETRTSSTQAQASGH